MAFDRFVPVRRGTVALATLAAVAASASAGPGFIYASGQLLTPGQNGHDDVRENFVYRIDITTGVATPVSPATTGLPAALAGTPDGRLLGFAAGQLSEVDPATGARTPIGSNNGLSATGFDITADGRGFITPFASGSTRQIHRLDLSTNVATALGGANEVGDAIDAASGEDPGTSNPFIISLGSVGNAVYGIDLDSNSLVEFDGASGAASVVGSVGAVGAANGPGYSGFSALTGVDESGDGHFDALYGSVNFFNDGTGTQRLGGVARFDLTTGAWDLIGVNEGVIFFGFGSSPIPSPAAPALLAAGAFVAFRRRR